MEKLKKTTAIVKYILENYPDTRNNDNLLYYKVCEHLNKDALFQSFGFMLIMQHSFGIPPFETVRRSRQKIQATYPELASNEKVKATKIAQEQIYRRYAKQKIN